MPDYLLYESPIPETTQKRRNVPNLSRPFFGKKTVALAAKAHILSLVSDW
jgi:hypothetical protein